MRRRKKTKFVHEGSYVAEVDVEVIEEEGGWSPCLSVEDAIRLDDVRALLKRNDVHAASRLGRIFELRLIETE